MNLDPVRQAPMWNAVHRNSAEILEEDQTGCLLLETRSGIYMVDHTDPQIAIQWIEKYLPVNRQPGLVSLNRKISDAVKKRWPVATAGPCIQYVYPGTAFPAWHKLTLRSGCLEDFELIRSHYQLADDQEIRCALQEQRLWIGINEKQETVGFAGEHAEGSMGFLEIFPPFRRKGYASIMEETVINLELRKGMIPYCHVFVPNEASHHLQYKCGLIACENEIEWMWIQPCSKFMEH